MNQTDQYFARATGHSRFLLTQLTARPWLAPRVAKQLDRPLERADLLAFLNEEVLTEANLGQRLRRLRAYVYAHAMVRDLNGLAPLPEVTGAMTLLAEVAVETSQRVLTAHLAERHGLPRNAEGEEQAMIVVGMGKLGGGELNVSSDIDLIFIYPEDGETDGARQIGAFEFHTRLGRAMIAAISEINAEGFVFRVDMRLRPNGDSGPLVANFDMLETYFISQGREWERYAWIKARALTGSRHDELDAIARPFVFRKYLDFGAINAMRALHAQIRREVARREMADNIKLGPGGIREIEFIAQVFQLIRGGRDAGLRVRPTLQVLDALAQRGLMPDDTVAELNGAYDFLRRLEHRIQYLDDAQTHMLPTSLDDRLRVATAMGFETTEALMAALDAHRVIVSRHFDAVFSEPTAEEDAQDNVRVDAWSADGETDSVCSALEQFGYHDPKQLCVRLRSFRDGPRYRAMSEEARSRLDAIVPRMLALAAARPNPDQALTRSIELLEAICRRSAYLALLQQYPQALSRVVELVSTSSWAANYLNHHPVLLDELLDSRNLSEHTNSTRFATELSQTLEALGDDTERQMDLMREAHHAQLFRLLNRDLAGDLTVESLSDKLSELADIVLEETLKQCWNKLTKRHAEQHRFAIIGYGKLGGKELGYASDLDIVFLHDDPDPEAQVVYARLAQRINTWISSRTSAGMLFETDLRLRPNGDSGLLVSSLEAFEEYQRGSAWVWEHQALTRARFCAGNREVGARFERLRHELLCQPRDTFKLRDEVVAMRKKMMDAHANKGAGFQLKHDAGGLIDVEFLVQFLVLAFANQWPELAANSGNIALLKLAANVGLLPADIAHDAANAYRQLRHAQHALRLNEHDSRIDDDSLAGPRAAVERLWQCVFELL
ncbi:bifunctional [glutamate--ammonia ligase]-adenylyl-L-tyrosine phosphorylase/[glutamate--ammonia-ligase] adenylyltransferase [Uliginosibacterium sp. H3]|uniref:Bifunctional glutamine synthetase adenylyltransferase/adenylyl-removing enzyme n=1 Tax=Uliginosibacterium silvisoli TaxID=3114758 RepID=A0ABU6K4J0_9RHOO|nr:bifunctional [glutamate--ammonia ligase]-adenylyl-L-tyrosine phosphorylase/[glutamate--ammonia-ligase] adenylyltransferase [Uliginosibacterium sp. H3]